MSDFQPSNGSENRAKQWVRGQDVTFPESGLTALLRKPSILSLAAKGRLPDLLTHKVMDTITQREKHLGSGELDEALGKKQGLELTPEMLPQLVEMLDGLCEACFISPKVIIGREPNIEKDEISPDMISDADKSYLLEWAMGEEGKAAGTFLGKSNAGVGIASRVQNLPEPVAASDSRD